MNAHERFVQVVARGIARADREHAEHLAKLKPGRALDGAERRKRSQPPVSLRKRP